MPTAKLAIKDRHEPPNTVDELLGALKHTEY